MQHKDKDFLLITDLTADRDGRCALDPLYVKGLEFRLRKVINLTIMGNEVNCYDKVFVNLLDIEVIDLAKAIDFGFRVLNKDYWEKYAPPEMQKEYKKIKK